MVPQETPSDADARWMSAGGIETVRLPLAWSKIEPTPGHYDWTEASTARSRWRRATISRCSRSSTGPRGGSARRRRRFPPRARSSAAPGRTSSRPRSGATAREATSGSSTRRSPRTRCRCARSVAGRSGTRRTSSTSPIPVSPADYSRLLADSAEAIRSVDPGARVLLGGLYGRPRGAFPKAMRAAPYLQQALRDPRDQEGLRRGGGPPLRGSCRQDDPAGRGGAPGDRRQPRRRRPADHRVRLGLPERPRGGQLRARSGGPGARAAPRLPAR